MLMIPRARLVGRVLVDSDLVSAVEIVLAGVEFGGDLRKPHRRMGGGERVTER